MYTLLIILHILICLVLILIVLLQAGKGADMGAAFGGSSQTVFGSSGAGTFLGKMTAGIAILFMITSLALTYTASHRSSSLMDRSKRPVTGKTLPVTMPVTKPVTKPDAAKLPVASPNAAKLPVIPPAAPVNK
jgi:preprotein translocase subunit SecG